MLWRYQHYFGMQIWLRGLDNLQSLISCGWTIQLKHTVYLVCINIFLHLSKDLREILVLYYLFWEILSIVFWLGLKSRLMSDQIKFNNSNFTNALVCNNEFTQEWISKSIFLICLDRNIGHSNTVLCRTPTTDDWIIPLKTIHFMDHSWSWWYLALESDANTV